MYGIEHAIPLTAAIISVGALLFQVIKQKGIGNGLLKKSEHDRICQLIQDRVQNQIDITIDDIKEIKGDIKDIKVDLSIIKEKIARGNHD